LQRVKNSSIVGFGRPMQEVGVSNGGVTVLINRAGSAVRLAALSLDHKSPNPDTDRVNGEGECDRS
jgi:hypothetical protein